MIEIEVGNFAKYNPRKDIKRTSWVRLNNDIFDDPDILEMNKLEKLIWVRILCDCSKKMSKKINISEKQYAFLFDAKVEEILPAVETIERQGLAKVTSRPRHACEIMPTRARTATNERTNERNVTGRTNEQNIGSKDPHDFQEKIATVTPKIPFEKFLLSWNAFSRENKLPSVSAITKTRAAKLKLRIEEGMTLEMFEAMLVNAAKQPFLLGENKRGWVMKFDWVVANDVNWRKVGEGSYGRSSRGDGKDQLSAAQRACELIENDKRYT